MDVLIERARLLLGYKSDEVVAMLLHHQGVSNEDAFLAIKAAKILDK